MHSLEDIERRNRRFADFAPARDVTNANNLRLFFMFLLAAVAIIFGSLYFRTLARPARVPTVEAPAPVVSAPPESKRGVVR